MCASGRYSIVLGLYIFSWHVTSSNNYLMHGCLKTLMTYNALPSQSPKTIWMQSGVVIVEMMTATDNYGYDLITEMPLFNG